MGIPIPFKKHSLTENEIISLFTDRVQPTEVSQELQYKKYENHFPVPVLENVYEGWDPVNHGHPLKDETLYYAPPSLERVVFNQQGPQSR